MKKFSSRLVMLFMIALLALPGPALVSAASPAAPAAPINFTILHTNDFHGNLEPAGSNPGMARLAQKVVDVRTAVGAQNVLLFDAGDEMQGSLLSNINQGEPTIAAYMQLDYSAATFGNHEFDWGQTVLADRVTQADYPYLVANLVTKTGADCTTAGWNKPAFVDAPYQIFTVGTAPNTVDVGVIGVTSQETPYITIASATDGLCFKDAADSIIHYYDEMKTAGADVMVVISHLGYTDGGYGYGFPVYGDQTLAGKLNTAGKPVNLIIGGHSHTDVTPPAVVVGTTTVVQAHYAGRKVGRADMSFDPATQAVTVNWSKIVVGTADPKEPAMDALITSYTSDPAYQAQINQKFGYTNVPLVRNYNSESLLSDFIQDSVYGFLNESADTAKHVDIVFNNAGGLRADITTTLSYPYTLTYGLLFNVLPFGNQTAIGTMTGAQVVELLNQSATLFKGALQPAGIKYKFYRYVSGGINWAYGAYDIQVWDKTANAWVALDATKTYKIATNEFLAPAGQDGFAAFKYMKNISYHGDMLDQVTAYVATHYATPATAYNGALDGRILREGDDTFDTDPIVPLTVLHHNDSHGNLMKGSFVGYTQLVTLINKWRAYNPARTLLLSSGDNIQGDAMMYYYRYAPQGFDTDGVALPSGLTTHPLIKAFNSLNYDAYVLGNHEFNFGSTVFKTVLGQATFPILQANVSETSDYGLTAVGVKPYVNKTVGPEGIKVSILGIGNHRVPNYELPSNIPGLVFSDPIAKTKELAPGLKAANDVVIGLTHIGFTENPSSVEVDANVDTNLVAQTTGLDVVIGGHSHTDPAVGFGSYKWLPTFVGNADKKPVLINHAYRYNNTLGVVMMGLRAKAGGGYEVVAESGTFEKPVLATTAEDPAVKALIQPYADHFATYNNKVVGDTTAPIDTLKAYTEETNGANLQADAAVWELAQHDIDVDFHISGAMTNKLIATGATPASPVTLKISDMFSAMPYENSLVTMMMNGPQLKKVLERAYRNYFYYKYVPAQGGYSYYTTCMLDINKLGKITYNDTYPAKPDGNNVISLTFNGGQSVNFADASTYYHVSTVNYLAAGSCNFNDSGVTLWPLNQIVNDTQFYVRDAVIHYMDAMNSVSPAVEGRLQFVAPTNTSPVPVSGAVLSYEGTNGEIVSFAIPNKTFNQPVTLAYTMLEEPDLGAFHFGGLAFNLIVYGADGTVLTSPTYPLTMYIHYTDADIAGMDESSLMLKYWNGTDWVDAACGAYGRYPAQNYFYVPVCHLSKFALTGAAQWYLPWVGK